MTWLAWLGLWLLIAASARADSGIELPASTTSNVQAPLWGILAMALVTGLWIIFTRISNRRASARIAIAPRRRPPHP